MRAHTLLQLTARERGLLLLAVPVVLAVRITLWILPSRTILRFVTRVGAPNRVANSHSRTPSPSIIWAVEAVSRRIPGATCLTQAIAAKLLLRWFGQQSQLCLGVAYTPDGAFRAHAWLERDGCPVLGGAGIQSLVRLPELPEGSPTLPR